MALFTSYFLFLLRSSATQSAAIVILRRPLNSSKPSFTSHVSDLILLHQLYRHARNPPIRLSGCFRNSTHSTSSSLVPASSTCICREPCQRLARFCKYNGWNRTYGFTHERNGEISIIGAISYSYKEAVFFTKTGT